MGAEDLVILQYQAATEVTDRAQARRSGVGLLRLFEVCAVVALRRVAPTAPSRACVSHGPVDVLVAGSDLPDDPSLDTAAAVRAIRGGAEPTCQGRGREVTADLVFHLSRDAEHLFAERASDCDDLPDAEVWAHTFLHLLSGMATDPRSPLTALPLLDEDERRRVLHRLNRHETPRLRHRTVTAPFEEQAERTPTPSPRWTRTARPWATASSTGGPTDWRIT